MDRWIDYVEIGHQSAKGYQSFFLRIGPLLVTLDFYRYRRSYCQVTFDIFLDLDGDNLEV